MPNKVISIDPENGSLSFTQINKYILTHSYIIFHDI